MTTRLIDETGREVSVAHEVLERGASSSSDKSATFVVSRALPLKAVAPGRYLVRVEAQLRGETGDGSAIARETSIRVLPQ